MLPGTNFRASAKDPDPTHRQTVTSAIASLSGLNEKRMQIILL